MQDTKKSFYQMSKWAFFGGLLGIVVGWIADELGLIANPFAEGIVRLTSGTMDSIAEMAFIMFAANGIKAKNNIKPYVYGTFIGTILAPISHIIIRSLGVDPYGPYGVIYAFAYSNSDNLFGTLTFAIYKINKNGLKKGFKKFISEPFQIGNIFALSLIFVLDLAARLSGFSPVRNLIIGIEAALMDADTVIASLFSVIGYKKKK